ncbi:MAG: InlB B-repeat-containing protein [Clostridia bacterium]|nr:InlB B-repeat-containing protein [Clostridia bacterium]
MKTAKKRLGAFLSVLVFAAVLLTVLLLKQNAETAPTDIAKDDLTVRTVSEEKTVLVPGNDYTIIFSSDDNQLDAEIATKLRSSLSKSGQRVNARSDAVQKEGKYEILIGNTNRELSSVLQEACENAVSNNSLVWGFAFRDGKFAFAAADNTSFERGSNDLFELFITDDFSFEVPSDLWLIVSLSRAEYEEELKAEQDRIEAEKEAERQKRIEALKGEIANFTYADFTDYVTLDFTVMPESAWGAPALYPTPGEHPRVNVTKELLELVREYIKTEEGALLYDGLISLTNESFNGVLNPAYEHTSGRIGFHNMNEKGLAIIEARAFAYLVTGDAEYGYNAILSMKNFLKTIKIGWISSDQCREFGRIIYCTAEIYDWCHDLLTEEDKNQFMVAVTDICASEVDPQYSGKCQSGDRQIEVGYPPSGQGSVSGHGSEHQILRDYLSVAIAIFDENPSWYNYVGARVYNDYIVTRNYYYQSGTYQQGIFNYGPFRHNADIWSAWLLLSATGENPYNDTLQNITNSFFEYQLPDGTFFGTGDGSRPKGPTARMMNDAELIAALYGDKGLRTRVLQAWNNFANVSGTSIDMSFAHFLILNTEYIRRAGTAEGEDIHSGKVVVSYHSYPVGQMMARSEWKNENAPAIFMKIGEKTTANHEHADAGSFQIFYKGLYSGESGVYDKYGSPHFRYYHQATVSHNSLLIFNPDAAEYELDGDSVETSTNLAKCFYSGGQRTLGETSTLESWLNNSSYNTGEVTGHEYVLNADGSADYAYLAGDITTAYQSSQASYVGRRMLTIFTEDESYPMYFVVYDRISALQETFVKKFLLHTPTEPVIDEETKTVTLTDGDGRLVLHSLRGGDTFEAIGGEGKNYYVNGIQCASATTKTDGMWGRVEISHTGTQISEFLSFMYVTDAQNDEKLAPATIETNLLTGLQLGSDVIIFAKSEERNTEELIFEAEGTGLNRYFVSGLFEGTWNIEVDGINVAHRVSSVDGGFITFYAPAGEVHVKPGRDIAPSNGGRIIYNSYGGVVPDDAPQVYEIGIPVVLPENIVRGRDAFLGWYTTPTFDEGTLITEVVGTDKGKFHVYAKYKAVPVLEDYEDKSFAFGEKTSIIGDLTYGGSGKAGSFFETIKDEVSGNTYLAMSRTETDMQLDSKKSVGDYIGADTAITFEIDLAQNGDKVPMSSNFRLRESSNQQTVQLFTTATDGTVKFGTTKLFDLTNEFKKVIITVDFAEGKITAYNIFGDTLATRSFSVPKASTAENTLDWMYTLSYTFNWWIGGGESILVDNVKVYCGAYDASELVLPEGEARIIYKASPGTLPEGYPMTYKAGVPTTLPIPLIDNGTFLGWYTTASFDEGTEISVIDKETAEEPVTVYAKYSITVFEDDFTGSTLDVDATSATVNDILYQFNGKTGTTAKAVTDALGNTYIRVYTDGADGSINNYADIASAILACGGKATFTIDLATLEDGRSGTSTFRLRASSSSDILPLFGTSGGKVYLGADPSLPIMTLGTSMQKVIITLDIYSSTLVALDPYGALLATKTVAPPKGSGIESLEEWISGVGFAFNWHLSSGGGIAFDNVSIYTGDYTPLIEEIPENSVKVNYQTNGGIFGITPDKYVSNEVPFTIPTDVTNGDYIFAGWYTSPNFESGTEITQIPAGLEGEITVFAKWIGTLYSNDFTGSTVDVADSSPTVDSIQYQFASKTGAYAKAVTDSLGNTYIKIYTDGTDATVNNFTSLADKTEAGGGKLTFTVDLATHEDGRSGTSTFRMRVSSSSDIIPIFSTAKGAVYLGADVTKQIATLSTELQRIAVTLDVNNSSITAYTLYGEKIASASVSVPKASTETSLSSWINNVRYCFNWYFSSGGGIAFDNVNIYVGDYIPETEVIPDGHTKVTYETNGGSFATAPERYAPTADADYILPTDISNGDFIFKGWYTTATFENGTEITSIPKGSAEEIKVYAKWVGKVFSESFTGKEGASIDSKNGTLPGSKLTFTANGLTGAKLLVVKDESGNEYLSFNRGDLETNDPQLRYNAQNVSAGSDGAITFHFSLALPDEGECMNADVRVRKYVTSTQREDFLLLKLKDGKVYLGSSTTVVATLTEDFTDVSVTYNAKDLTLTAYTNDGTVIAQTQINANFGTDWAQGIDNAIYFRATGGNAIKIDNVWIAECGFDPSFI